MKSIKWFLTGTSVAILIGWCAGGGFSNFTETQIILMLFTVGATFGYWVGSIGSDKK